MLTAWVGWLCYCASAQNVSNQSPNALLLLLLLLCIYICVFLWFKLFLQCRENFLRRVFVSLQEVKCRGEDSTVSITNTVCVVFKRRKNVYSHLGERVWVRKHFVHSCLHKEILKRCTALIFFCVFSPFSEDVCSFNFCFFSDFTVL